jgi:NAD(P)-dependent dehydrogenase (short-subunit alcohol dehydrogenase family)
MKYIKTLFNIENKVAVITGGSGVLGSAIASGLLRAGAKVVVLGTNLDKLQKSVNTLRKSGQEIIGIQCNVLDEKNIRKANSQILKKFNHLDILINAAGGHIPGAVVGIDQTIFDITIDDFEKVTRLNLFGTVLPTLIFGNSMADQGFGSIINISSMATQRAISRAAGYSTAKAAVENFTRWLAVELAQKFGEGIRVNAIAPGFLLTDQNRRLLTNPDGSLTERGKTIINITPFRRFGNPEELIGTVLWLASNASKFITGAIIPVDGGFSAYSGV